MADANVMGSIHCRCFGWCRDYGVGLSGELHHRGCKLWSRELRGAEVHLTAGELIVLGTPDDEDESHNCDAMGCSSVSHVLFRFPLPDGVPAASPLPQQIPLDPRIAQAVGDHLWELMTGTDGVKTCDGGQR